MKINEAEKIIHHYQLEPHPEGGYFTQTYQATDEVKSTDINRYQNKPRKAATAIYYLLNNRDYSAWHRLKSDELWHFYKGCAVYLYVIHHQSGKLTTHILGDTLQINNACFQVCIKAGDWFAAENIDILSYSFVGCTVSPGFEYSDFELAEREQLIHQFPEHRAIIERLTR